MAKHTEAHELAQAFDVHFFILGNRHPASDGYTLNLSVIDGATEHPLTAETFPV